MSNEKTLSEIKQLKNEMDKKLTDIVNEFQKETGVAILDITGYTKMDSELVTRVNRITTKMRIFWT